MDNPIRFKFEGKTYEVEEKDMHEPIALPDGRTLHVGWLGLLDPPQAHAFRVEQTARAREV
jgi:hypothetical protein